MGLDPGAIQAVSAASGVWRADGRLQGFYRSKLTRSQVQHDSGLIQARHNTQRWNDNVKLELQHLAAATPAGTSLVAIQRHVAVTLATWDAVWGEYLHPKWAEQRMRLHGAQEKVLERYFKKLEEEAASVSQQEWGADKQLVVFFGNAGIGTRGGWGAKAALQACRKVVERPNSGKPTDRVPGRVVTVDEFCTSRVSSILNSPQPCEEELGSSKPTRPEDWKPKPGQVQDRLLRSAWRKRFEAPLEKDMAELSMKRHKRAKQLVVFFGAAGIGTGGGGVQAQGAGQRRGRVVLVDEHRTTRVSSAVNGKQPCEEELNTLSATRPAGWKPPAGQVEQRLVRPAWSQQRGQPARGLMWCPVVAPRKPSQAPRSSQSATQPAASEPRPSTPPPAKRSKLAAESTQPTKGKGKAQGKAAKAKPAPQPGRWLDRDCNAALNMQRIGESRWRPLELCYWPDLGALPAKGKEYPGLGYKRLRDKPPSAQEQQPAGAQ
ncbi:hypothetical protein QJQ45_028163 [Haematococcus lacustris]|nr:hypothetical protein QJQ45_028163 [Haematococcus lacustris]